jgi:hypothetical protein
MRQNRISSTHPSALTGADRLPSPARGRTVPNLFGLIVLITAGNLLRTGRRDDGGDGAIIRPAKRFLPASEHYDGDKLFTGEDGERVPTPMLLLMVAIGSTAFSLKGLRQLFSSTACWTGSSTCPTASR